MWLPRMAWKNMWRNRTRTAITMAAIFFAVILSVIASSLKDGIFDNLVKNVVSFYTGYIQVHKKGYWEEQILDNSFETSPALREQILKNRNVSFLSARLESFALVSAADITKAALVVGIDPIKEDQITSLKKKLVNGNYLAIDDTAILLAEGLAARLKINTGDTLVMIGQGYHGATAAGKYRISGIVKFGSPELNDKMVIMPLPLAQDLYGAYNRVTSYILALDDTKKIGPTAAALDKIAGNEYEVMTWEELSPEIKQHIETDSNNMKYIQGILYILICFGIFGTLMMMMVERRREMGMLVAIGMKKSRLSFLLIIESITTVLAGCILGILASIPLVYFLNRNPIKMGGETAKAYERFGFEAIFPTSTDASNFIYQGMVVLLIGLLLSLYPLLKVIRLDPVKAMKQ